MATAAGLIFGTARYISPEGAQGEKVAPQGDVYSIATMVYQCLAGRTPFDGDQAVALLVQQIHDAPPHLKSIPRAAYVPDPLADVIMKNLAKRPDERADSARTLGRTLLDAAVASGLSAQDILARPMMSGGRAQQSSIVQMPPLNRTRQHPFDPDVAARIEASSRAAGNTHRTPVRTEIAEPVDLPPGTATTKWTPPADFETKLVPVPGASVDLTMDDQQLSTRSPAVVTSPPNSRTAPTAPPAMQRYATPLPSSPSLIHQAPSMWPGARGRALGLVVLCFLVGAVITGAFAYRAGFFGSHGRSTQVAAAIGRANDALSHERWDTPPGDNVRDILADALQRWPGDAELLRVRSAAADRIVSAASARSDHGEEAEASRLVALAEQLDPSNERAKKLSADLAVAHDAAAPSSTSSLPPLASTRTSGGTSSAAGGSRVALEASSAKPVPGQPVDFTARVVATPGAHPKVDGGTFRIAGPGVAPGTQLAASDDGSGAYHTTFAFLQAGRFEVSFSARADGSTVRGSRVVVVGQGGAAVPAGPAAAEAPTAVPPATPPAPTGSVKWL
jgi:serine/threonine-protein kinase